MQVASHRLIDAAAELAPGDRALLSLLINHGLDDGALARVMHATPEEIAIRRGMLADRLGSVLELPSSNVEAALNELAGNAREHRAEVEPSDLVAEPASAGNANGAATIGTGAPAPRTRRRGWIGAGLGLLIVVVIVIATAGGSSTTRTTASTTTRTGGAPATTPAPVLARSSLVVLPGGPAGVTGRIEIVGSAASPRLTLSISGLPRSSAGGYELWLYNSVIDSRPLAAVGAPNASVTVALPTGYRRYRFLDIELQPSGDTVPSGESVLRAVTPR